MKARWRSRGWWLLLPTLLFVLLVYVESSQLIWRASRISIGMTEPEVDALLDRSGVWAATLRHAFLRGGRLQEGRACGIETAAYFKEFEDDTAWIQVGFDQDQRVSGYWILAHEQKLLSSHRK